ncbi:MAG: PIN domain-containing protein [Verrucomicrobia bacterium]|nr:PIN domain-containing protein [Verrucomicrobiota bacterium]
MRLVDTSLFIEALREQGQAANRARFHDLLIGGEVCWCPMVRVELWHGARGTLEKRMINDFEQTLPELEITPEVWELACELGRRARAKGLTVPNPDLLIAAVARHHKVPVEAADAHFAELAKL